MAKEKKNKKVQNANIKLPGIVKLLSNMKIGARINACILAIILILIIPLIIMVVEASSYQNSYNKVLENLDNINYIMDSTESQGDRIIGYCVVDQSIVDSGETEIIVKMDEVVKKIRQNIGTNKKYNANLEQLDVVENLLYSYIQSYKDGVAKCSDSFSLAGDTEFYSMVNTSEYLSKNCNKLLSLELKRSMDLKADISSKFMAVKIDIIIVMIIIIVFALIASISLTKSITLPLNILRKRISVIAEGDLTGEPIIIGTKDEIRDIAEVYNVMKDNLTNILEKVSGVSGEIDESVGFVTGNVENNSSSSEKISSTVDTILQHLEQQNDETRTAKEHMEKIDHVSGRISENADRIRENAEQSLSDSRSGNENISYFTKQLAEVNSVMNEVSVVVEELEQSTQEMNDIINTITDIADQTNLLSLNAAIEAARAGESGRGFSVVASEINALAEHSSESAQQISEIIQEVQSKANSMTEKMEQGLRSLEEGNKIAGNTRRSFENIQKGVLVVNDDVQEIINDIKQLSVFVKTVHTNMDTIHSATDNNVTVTSGIVDDLHEETENLSKVVGVMAELSERAKQLEETVTNFKLQ